MHFIYEVADKKTGQKSVAFVNARDKKDAEAQLQRRDLLVVDLSRAIHSSHSATWRALKQMSSIGQTLCHLMILISALCGLGLFLYLLAEEYPAGSAVFALLGGVGFTAFWWFCSTLLMAAEWLCFYVVFHLPPQTTQDS